MKNKKLLFSFIFISLILLMIGCRNKQDHIYISTEVKDLGYFQKNSYWIFKNETTQKIDSTYVSKDPTFTTGNEESKDETLTDQITINFNSSFLRSFLLAGEFIIGNIYSNEPCIFYDGGIGIGQSLGTNFTYVNNYDSFPLNDTTYNSVYHTRYTIIDLSGDTLTSDFYLVPHVGPIKIIIKWASTDTTYSLIRYQVSQ